MDFSFLSTNESSVCLADQTHSFMRNYEADCQFSDYSNIVEYQPNSKISEICIEFREITKNASGNNNYLNMITNYVDNLSTYLKCVINNLRLLPQSSDSELQSINVLVANEIKTWKLIFQLYEDRFKHMACESSTAIARTSELDLVRDLYDNNTQLRESQIVVDWLEDCMKENLDKHGNFLMATDGKAWEHTKHTIRKKNNLTPVGNCLLNELDPDAPLRGKLNLSDSDKNDEIEYLRYIFHCLQCGDIEKAQILCQNHDEWWRALSLDGWKPFYNPLINDIHLDNTDIVGNSNRNVFKSVCYQLSEDTKLNIYERAIYATFCGNISVLCLVQKEWGSLLWAYFKSYTEHVVDDYLHTFTINGSFATQSLFGDDDIDLGSLGLTGNEHSNETLAHSSREQIFDDIASKLVHSPIAIVKNGARLGSKLQMSFYRSLFEVVQQFIIVDDIEGLVHIIDVALVKLPSKKSSSDKLLLRFLAHVVMFVYSVHVDMQMDLYHRVLEHYIECLIDDHSLSCVSFYVSKLSTDLQIKWYCRAMSVVTEYEDKCRSIIDGIEYDLPILEISNLVVRTIRTSSTSSDHARINGLDWLTVVPEQHCHLVRQTNALCRTFLDQDKHEMAKMALNKTSKDIITRLETTTGRPNSHPRWLPSALYENKCLKAFVAAYDAFVDWHNHFSSKRPEKKEMCAFEDLNKLSFHEKQVLQREYDEIKLSVDQWDKSGEYLGNRAMDLFVATLKMGDKGWLSDIGGHSDWLEDDEEDGHETDQHDNDTWRERLQQVARLRRKNVASICFQLMKVVDGARTYYRCFEITDLLADQALSLYEHLDRAQLQRLMQQVRQCSLALMTSGADMLGIDVL